MTTTRVDPFEADIRRDPCPVCRAEAGQACRTNNERPLTEAHRGRERAWQVRRAREHANGTARPIVDWNDPEWGGHVHVSSGGDLAGEQPNEGEQ